MLYDVARYAFVFTIGLVVLSAAANGEAVRSIPANTNAGRAATALLDMLYALPSRTTGSLIAGQHCGGAVRIEERYRIYADGLAHDTGQKPVLIGSDFIGGFSDAALRRLISHWRSGGLVTICWHASNPWTGGSSDDLNTGDIADLITPGTKAYAVWQRQLSQASQWLAVLRDAGVPVLWRPFHEMNLPGSHWWTRHDKASFIAVWRQMFNRFSTDERLDNLLWVYSPNAEFKSTAKSTRPAAYYYPGAEYVDVTGLDIYTRGPLKLCEAGYNELVALGKPMALCEFGPRGPNGEREPPDHTYDYRELMRQLRDEYPEIVYFMAWTDSFSLARQNGAADLLNDVRVLKFGDAVMSR